MKTWQQSTMPFSNQNFSTETLKLKDSKRCFQTLAYTFLGLCTAWLNAQSPYSASYIVEWGNDTIAVETFTMIENHSVGKVVHGFPENHVRTYDFVYNKDGSFRSQDVVYWEASNTALPFDSKTGYLPYKYSVRASRGVLDYEIVEKKAQKDIEVMNQSHFSSGKRIFLESDGFHFSGDWIPIMSQFEHLVQTLLKSGRDSLENLRFVNPYFPVQNLHLRRVGKHEFHFWSNISEGIKIYTDDEDHVSQIDLIGSAWNMKVYRIDPIEIEPYAKKFAERPMIGDPSPQEVVSANVKGTTITIDYGRPYKRDRTIFGGIVPYGEVWRTGAGSTTKLTIDKPIRIGKRELSPSTYNLYTIPEEERWTLIINNQENAWGSIYLPEFDLEHLTMQKRTLSNIVDQFAIEILENKEGGILKMSWDDVSAEISFTTL